MPNMLARLLALIFCAALFAGCGTQMTVRNVIQEPSPETIPSPSNTPSAALLSGFRVSRGGDHYRMVQALGGAMAKPTQESEGGIYNIKLNADAPSIEDEQ